MRKNKTSLEKKPFLLVILDGWGFSKNQKGNAAAQASVPCYNRLWAKYPHTVLAAAGLAVGLPKWQIGNSEAGHMNIGAGRVIRQDAALINDSIANGTFFKNPAFLQAIRWSKKKGSRLHLLGLLTGVQSAHADRRHLDALLSLCKACGLCQVYLHLFLDGRDSLPMSGLQYLKDLQTKLRGLNLGKIASLTGRYYAMDRIGEWKRIQATYDNLTLGNGAKTDDAAQAMRNYYAQGITDEFIPPTLVANSPPVLIEDNDAVIFFNLRTDRAKQISQAFVRKEFKGFHRKNVLSPLCFVTMTEFGPGLSEALIAYPGRLFKQTLPKIVGEDPRYHQFYIAESEKFPHVTYFLNGGFPQPVDRERRLMIPSSRVKSYAEKPEMKAREITDQIIKVLKEGTFNFIAVNYANPDMIGHTGNLQAAVVALEFLDKQLARLVRCARKMNGAMLITADHGNVEEMIDLKTGGILTSHTANPVPFIFADFNAHKPIQLKKRGKLSNIAPTILDFLNIPKPAEMAEESLIVG